MIESVDDEMK